MKKSIESLKNTKKGPKLNNKQTAKVCGGNDGGKGKFYVMLEGDLHG